MLMFEMCLCFTDRRRYLLKGHTTSILSRNLTESTPYGINLVRALKVSDQYVSNRKICIIDSGYDITHQDLPKPTVTGANGVNGMLWYKDEYIGHGTHVVGTIAAVGNNNKGVIGINRNNRISIHNVRVFGIDGDWISGSSLVKAVEHCRDVGSNIVSMSLGGDGFSNFELDAFTRIYEEDGVMLVAAAGNKGDGSYSYPASYTPVISVAAIDSKKQVAYFSQRNNQVDLSGPGVSILSTYPGNNYAYMSGTSMATPHVSGVAALVWSHFPDQSAQRIRRVLENTAEDLGPAGRDNRYGHGLVRADLAYKRLSSNTVSRPTTDCLYPTTNIIIKTDNRPYETTWTLTDDVTGRTIKSEGTYGLRRYNFISQLCLVPGRYKIRINDSGANGLCCRTGRGFYKVVHDGVVLVSGKRFRRAVSKRFTISLKPSSSPTTSPMPTELPSIPPSNIPSTSPSFQPSSYPSVSQSPTTLPSQFPSMYPTVSSIPSVVPSDEPTNVPSISSLPSSQPSVQPTPRPKPACKKRRHMHVEVLFKTDANSNENTILLMNRSQNRVAWRITNIPRSTTVSYGKCVAKRRCYQLVVRDRGSNGLNDGYISVSVDGTLITSTTFPRRKRWKSPRFGRC